MSNHLISMAYKRKLGSPMRKAVMVLLADKASDDGSGVWASKQTMADELDCSRQAIINTIAGFIEDKLIVEVGQRQNANGFTVEYAIKVEELEALPLVTCHATRQSNGRVNLVDGSTSLTGQSGGLVNDVDPTRQRGGHKPPLNPSPPVKAKALPTPAGGSPAGDDDSGKADPPKPADPPAPAKVKKRPVGVRLSEDWQAPPIAELPLETQAIVAQWPAGAYEHVAIQFRNHWRAEGRALGAKRDWPATWHNWLFRESSSILRAAKAGQSFATALPAGAKPSAIDPAESALIEDVMRLKDDEPAVLAELRKRIRHDIGVPAYDVWLRPTAMRVKGNELRILCPSRFKASWVDQHYRAAIQTAAEREIGEDVVVRFKVAQQPAQPAGAEELAA